MPVAQLDRASDYESEGWEFDSLRARQKKKTQLIDIIFTFITICCVKRGIKMSTTTQTNVLKLDSKKEGQSSKDNSLKKLIINYSRDKNLNRLWKINVNRQVSFTWRKISRYVHACCKKLLR